MERLLGRILIAVIMTAVAGCEIKQTAPPQVNAANEIAAITRLRSIATAEMVYQAETDGGYATLSELIERGYVNDLSRGKLNGYRFEVQVRPGGFNATAVPEKFAVTGRRSFYIDETLVMRGAEKGGRPATATDPQI